MEESINEFWQHLFEKRIKDDSLTKEEFCWYESRKFNRGVIRGTLFDILCTRNMNEVEGEYGDTRYIPLGISEIECTITSDLKSMDNPAVYEISDVEYLDGIKEEITQLASLTHTYAGEVLEGERVIARGKVEKVVTNNQEPIYRILVGSTRESIGEYIKLKEFEG